MKYQHSVEAEADEIDLWIDNLLCKEVDLACITADVEHHHITHMGIKKAVVKYLSNLSHTDPIKISPYQILNTSTQINLLPKISPIVITC